jgi:hypothetical protein
MRAMPGGARLLLSWMVNRAGIWVEIRIKMGASHVPEDEFLLKMTFSHLPIDDKHDLLPSISAEGSTEGQNGTIWRVPSLAPKPWARLPI